MPTFDPAQDLRWLREVLPFPEVRIRTVRSGYLCLMCKGRGWCGKPKCPVLLRAQALAGGGRDLPSSFLGSSPPSVFVGRLGYPKVLVGPMVPPYTGETGILDTPELWMGKSVEELVNYRSSLVRGMVRSRVEEARGGNRMVEVLQEMALGGRPVEAEVVLEGKPRSVLTLGEEIPPMGPSAPLRRIRVSGMKADPRLEKAYYDGDLRAQEAVVELYEGGLPVSRIQRVFSLGALGLKSLRKLVPTRWSITAVDSLLSEHLLERIKHYETIDEYRVYSFRYLHNLFVAILMPEKWSFDWMEGWFPGTTWNPESSPSPALMGDWEPYQGRKSYPEIGGCYYACRLAVAEALEREKKQASAVVRREIYPGYLLPLGVWLVRESIREMLRGEPKKFENLQEALTYAGNLLTVPLREWVRCSGLLRRALFQKKLTEFTTRN